MAETPNSAATLFIETASSPYGIEESGFARIGGIDQWISIRGEDHRNPVILELHGGPPAPPT